MFGFMLFAHWVADSLLQTREMGRTKSEKISVLLKHVAIQAVVVALVAASTGYKRWAELALYNAIIHGIIDWFIWRGYKISVFYRVKKVNYEHKYYPIKDGGNVWMYWEDDAFYKVIMFDQFLHGITLWLLWSGLCIQS